MLGKGHINFHGLFLPPSTTVLEHNLFMFKSAYNLGFVKF